jgi:hypothetical protein
MLVPYNYTLEEMIMQDTKEMILQNAKLLQIRLNRKDKKTILAGRLADTILQQPLVVLRRLPYTELIRLQKMVHDKDHAVPFRYDMTWDCMTQIGLTDQINSKDGLQEFIYPDLAGALSPVIDDYIAGLDPNSGKFRFERIALGLLNLYGLLSFEKLADLCNTLDPELTAEKLEQAIEESFLLNIQTIYHSGNGRSYTSPFLDDPEYLIKEIKKRHFDKEVRFSLEEVLSADDNEKPQPPKNEMSGVINDLLLSVLGSEEEVSWWISRSWMQINNDRSYFDLIQELFDDQGLSIDQLNQVIFTITDWTNLLPRWIMKGNSSREIFETFEKSKLRPLPSEPFPGFSGEESSSSHEPFNEPKKENTRKPGRNDPCPCGSGKKYKHCCGKIS